MTTWDICFMIDSASGETSTSVFDRARSCTDISVLGPRHRRHHRARKKTRCAVRGCLHTTVECSLSISPCRSFLMRTLLCRSRVCIKIPTTPESIIACQRLESEGIRTLATCLFSLPQALAASQAKCLYIAPYFNGSLRSRLMGIVCLILI